MQSPNLFMVLSVIGAVVTANAIAAAPATAESEAQPQPPTVSQSAVRATPPAAISQSDQLDRLQTESQLRQQLNQSQFGVSYPASNSLRFDQQVQQQLDLQELESQQNIGVRPSSSLDRLQFEQRIRRSLQPAARPAEQSQAVAVKPEDTKSEDTKPEDIKPEDTSAAAPSSEPQVSTQTAAQAEATPAPVTRQQRQQAKRWVKEAASRMTAPETASAPSSPPASPPASTAVTPTTAETLPVDLAPTPVAPVTETAQAESQPLKPSADPAPSPTSPPEAPAGGSTKRPASQPERPPSANIYSTEGFSPDVLAPEYLNPDVNPLAFPTQPSEVEMAGTQPITIRQAIELALRNNPTIRQAQFQLERSQADLRRSQASNLPTVDAVGGFTQAGSEVGSTIPATRSDGFGGQTPLVVQDPDNPGQTIPDPRIGDVIRNYTDTTRLSLGLEVNYSIFTSGRRPALIRAAEQQVRIQQLEIERQSEQLILDTAGDYYDLQQASAQVNIFQANLTQAEQSLRDAQALERAGVGTRFDSLQAEVDVANARQRLTQQLSTLEIAQRQLGQRLNISQAVNIAAADPIEVAGVWDLSLEETIVQAYKNRVELEQQLVQRDSADQNRKAALAALGPQVGFQGAFNLSSEDFELNGGPNYNYSLGVSARMALYDGGEARSQANREESNISIAESEFEVQRNAIRLDIERGYSRLNSSFANIQTTALAVEQAAEALRLARLRFQAGVGTQTDVLRQQSVLAEAQVNNLTAILDYNRALAVLQRGTSNYPEGYLNDVP